MFKYSIYTVWSDEDDGYIATIPEFPDLSAFGETAQEAVEEAMIAAEGFIEVYEEDGENLPDPIKTSSFSGQTRVRLPKSLHASLSQEAQTEGVSLNTYIVHLLSERNGFKKVERKLEDTQALWFRHGFSERTMAITDEVPSFRTQTEYREWDSQFQPETEARVIN